MPSPLPSSRPERRPSYLSGPASEPLIGETIGDNLDRVASAHPGTLALVDRGHGIRLTYAQLLEQVDAAARGLLALRIGRGERVGIWSPNRAEWTVLQYATAKIGAILVNINPAYRPDELVYALEQSGTTRLVTAAGFKSSDYVAMTAAARRRLPGLRTVVHLDSAAGDLDWPALLAGGAGVDPDELRHRQGQLQFDDPINIQYTSGTTGFPKGATLSHHNILNNGYQVTGIQGLGVGDPLCIPVPLYHCFGMVLGNLGCTTRAATMVYPGEGFDPRETLATLSAERCVAVYGVPTMFIAMLEVAHEQAHDLSRLRTGVMAGAPCPVEVMRRCIDELNLRDITIAYGMTETSPVSFQTRPGAPLDQRVTTVGEPLPFSECKVVDEHGDVVDRGVPGEVCTRGYLVMREYWGAPEQTREAIDAAGWMHTGDQGVIDDDGCLRIVGRLKDMIIRGGENIYPREIEEVLITHPSIADAQVVGVPDERLGEQVCAWVQLHAGAHLDLDDLRAWCSGRIAHFKIPRYLRIVDEFPMTVTGKVRKVEMRAISAAETAREHAPA